MKTSLNEFSQFDLEQNLNIIPTKLREKTHLIKWKKYQEKKAVNAELENDSQTTSDIHENRWFHGRTENREGSIVHGMPLRKKRQ